jgi:osmotically-inducible protein OsmY
MPNLRPLAAVFFVAFSGWSGTEPVRRAPPPKTAAASAPSDAEIEKNIRARLAKSKIAEDNFRVRVQGGIATLEGKTDVLQHKGVATRLAKSGGASAIVNRIQISEAAREKAAKNLETGRRRAQIKRSEARSEALPARGSR